MLTNSKVQKYKKLKDNLWNLQIQKDLISLQSILYSFQVRFMTIFVEYNNKIYQCKSVNDNENDNEKKCISITTDEINDINVIESMVKYCNSHNFEVDNQTEKYLKFFKDVFCLKLSAQYLVFCQKLSIPKLERAILHFIVSKFRGLSMHQLQHYIQHNFQLSNNNIINILDNK